MGYTHYWEHRAEPSLDAWKALMGDVKKIAADKKLGKMIAGYDGTGKPEITEDEIRFNGKKPEDYETFHLTRKPEAFNFCKTGFTYIRGYDLIVTLILIRAKARLGDAITVSSDGYWDPDWKPAREEHERIFGETAPNPITEG